MRQEERSLHKVNEHRNAESDAVIRCLSRFLACTER